MADRDSPILAAIQAPGNGRSSARSTRCRSARPVGSGFEAAGLGAMAAVGIHRGDELDRRARSRLARPGRSPTLVGEPPPGGRPRRAGARERPAHRGDHPAGRGRARPRPPPRRARRAHPARPAASADRRRARRPLGPSRRARRSARAARPTACSPPTAPGYETPDDRRRPPADRRLARRAVARRAAASIRRWRAGEGSILERFEPGGRDRRDARRSPGPPGSRPTQRSRSGSTASSPAASWPTSTAGPIELHVNQETLDSVARIVGISLANFRLARPARGIPDALSEPLRVGPGRLLSCATLDAGSSTPTPPPSVLLGLPLDELRGRHIGDFLRSDAATRAEALELIEREGRGVFDRPRLPGRREPRSRARPRWPGSSSATSAATSSGSAT